MDNRISTQPSFSPLSSLLQREQISGLTGGRLVTGGQRKHGGRIVVLVLDLGGGGRLDLEFLRFRLGRDRRNGQLEAGRENLQLLEGRVGVDRAAERLHVLGPDLGEILHRLDVLTAHVADALQAAVRQRHVILAGLLGLLLVHLLVLELVHRVDGLGLETKKSWWKRKSWWRKMVAESSVII